MESRFQEVESRKNKKIRIRIIPGHFATSHSHINYYIDMTQVKYTYKKANHVAADWALAYEHTINVDTIVTLDGTEVIGGLLAQKLSEGSMSLSKDVNISIIAPEFNTGGQMMFRDNAQPLIWKKNVVVTAASLTTGKTINSALNCIRYYGGNTVGISTIFSTMDQVEGIHVNTVFAADELPKYETYPTVDCKFCKDNIKIDALVNSFGYSRL